MNRRNVLKGLAAASISSVGLAFGSGAFTQTTVTRDFSVSLAESDRDSQLVIEATDLGSSVIQPTKDGQFAINAQNIAPNARTTYGRFDSIRDPGTLQQGAFVIRNENDTGASIDIGIALFGIRSPNDDNEFVIPDPDLDTTVELAARHPNPPEGEPQIQTTSTEDFDRIVEDPDPVLLTGIPSTEDGSDDTPPGVSPSEAEVQCGFIIDTTSSAPNTDLGIKFNIIAQRTGARGGPE
jgi:hypothetical protein